MTSSRPYFLHVCSYFCCEGDTFHLSVVLPWRREDHTFCMYATSPALTSWRPYFSICVQFSCDIVKTIPSTCVQFRCHIVKPIPSACAFPSWHSEDPTFYLCAISAWRREEINTFDLCAVPPSRREDHTFYTWNREDHTFNTWHREDHTFYTWHREDHIFNTWHREDQIFNAWHHEDHIFYTWYREDSAFYFSVSVCNRPTWTPTLSQSVKRSQHQVDEHLTLPPPSIGYSSWSVGTVKFRICVW